jgi:hypothetical protein
LDLIHHVFPEAEDLIQTNAHDRIEVILQNYTLNIPAKLAQKSEDGMILHLVNLTGFSGNTYFEPLPLRDIEFTIKSEFKPSRIWTMMGEKSIEFNWVDGRIKFKLDGLDRFEGVVIEK